MDIECSKCGRHFPEGTPDSVIKAHAEMHDRPSQAEAPKSTPAKKKSNIFDGVIFPHFSNPSMLAVKMLLSEMRVWVNNYDWDNYNCVDFSREIISRMTSQEVRCGFVEIHFDKGPGHAIVAFETDHGLIFIEPQSGEQVDVFVGKRYSGNSQGVPDDPIIADYDIAWNS